MQTNSKLSAGRAFGHRLRRFAYLATTLAMLAVPQFAQAADRFVPADPEPGTDIPKATIKFGMRPYADNTFYYIGMKKGWFDEVGISFDPAPYGMKANDSNVTTLLLNGQLDIISEFCPLMLPTYKDATTLKCIGFTDNFLANAILANPALKLKSFKDYIAEGKSYEDALKAALAPMKGKVLTGAPQLSDRAFEEYLNKTSGAGFKLQVLDDSKALVLAKSGQLDFLNPEGAPIVYTLRQAGWTSLVDIGDLIKYGPGGVDSPLEPLIGIVGVGANGDYVNKNPNTVLRFMSVVWRIIAETGKDPSLFDIQAPYLNSFAGTDLDGKGVEETIKILDPLTPFEQNAQYYDDPNATTNFKNVWGAVIKDFEAHKVIPAGKATPEDVVWGGDIWHLMVDYKKKSDALLAKVDAANLAADKQEVVKKAKAFYDAYDFLDSYRLLTSVES
ncbi:ABC transporter substrate-binding protein [Rhizobium binxianense]